MTFTEIQTEILDRLNITSSTSTTRIGRLINQVYRAVTTSVGLSLSRQVSTSALTSIGSSQVTFTDVVKIDRVWFTDSDGVVVPLREVMLDELRGITVASGDNPTRYAIWKVTADTITIQLDTTAETAFTLSADAKSTATTLSGSAEPAFHEDFHDILIEGVLIKEYRKDEKQGLARDSEVTYKERLAELRMWVAKSNLKRIRQGDTTKTFVDRIGGSSGGSAGFGQTAQTITEQWTFDRDPSAPFAVTDGSAYVANLYTEGVGNVATDRLIGRDTAGTGESEQLTVGNGLEFTGSGGIGVANDGVTYARMQNVSAASRLLGRGSASSGDVQELTVDTDGLQIASTVLGLALSGTCEGRLTVSTGLAIPVLDISGAGTIYFTPYKGNRIALYNGTTWDMYSFTERSLALSITSGVNYDVFIYDNAGTLTLEVVAWTNDTTRATSIVLQDGVYVKSGTTTKRYLGTIRGSGANVVEDSATKRFVWNYYNRVRRFVRVIDATDSWTYTTATYRQARATTTNKVEIVTGVLEDAITIAVRAMAANNTGAIAASVAIGEDSTTTPVSNQLIQAMGGAAANVAVSLTAELRKVPTEGYHSYVWLEKSAATGTTTWYGDNADSTLLQSGLHGDLMC
jgi:hypothetical protein